MSVDVIYFVESVPKELDVACIVSQRVEKEFGLRVQIASYKSQASEWLRRAKPKLLVVPTCYSADGWGLKKFVGQWPDAPYLNLTWEELFCKANQTWKHPRDEFAKRHVLHHVWGEFYKGFLTSYGVPDQHIVVNGHPGYKLYESPYREYFPTRTELAERHRLDPAKKWILLPENYGWAFYGDANMAARVRSGIDEELIDELRGFCRKSLKTVLEWCRECGRDPGVELIVRPRPTTRLSHFEEVSRELLDGPLDGIRLIKDGTVNEWILASDIVVSSFSTSLIEAAIAGKPAYMLEPYPLPDALWSIWYEEAECLRTREEFLDACLGRQSLASSEQRLKSWAHRTMLSQGDPIKNLVNIIGQICDGTLKPPAPARSEANAQRPQRSLVNGFLRDSWHSVQSLVARKDRDGDQDSRVFRPRDVAGKMREWTSVLKESTV